MSSLRGWTCHPYHLIIQWLRVDLQVAIAVTDCCISHLSDCIT